MAINIKLSELGKVGDNKSSTFNHINNIDVSDKSINAIVKILILKIYYNLL